MTTLTHKPATKGQIRQITRVGADAIERVLEELELDKDAAQLVHGRGNEFAAVIREAALASLPDLSVSDRFADEEVQSSYGYPSGYGPKGIAEQVARLRELFPEFGSYDEELAEEDLPLNAKGWFAIPRWEKIANTYGEAVQKVLDLIKETRDGRFYNHREGQLGPQYLRQHEHAVTMLKILGDQQSDHDILVVAAQFGLRHRGRSVRRARELFTSSEFGLGAFQIACMLLTHPERLQHYDDLWVDCAGDEFDSGADGDFSGAPFFNFYGGKVEFVTGWGSFPHAHRGSGSAFLPQS